MTLYCLQHFPLVLVCVVLVLREGISLWIFISTAVSIQ
jgi:hypothetical protein